MKRSKEKGQALLLATVALAIFVIGAVGLVVDGAHIFANNQMAQSAADAAAIAGIMSIFDGTNVTGPNPFSTLAPHTCTTTDPTTPCVIARSNGFGQTASDIVVYDFPANGSYPGISFAPGGDNLMRVTITRTLDTTLMRLLGSVTTTTAKAIAVAAIVDVVAPVPIVVTHPEMDASFNVGGNVTIRICGGPSRSIQVNSKSAISVGAGGSSVVDLSKAGPNDPGNCSLGTGADFGDWGGPKFFPGTLQLGSTGHYIQPASPILDPLSTVSAPAKPGAAPAPAPLANGVSGCPASPPKPCTLYSPGDYPSGIDVKNETAVFKPGIYYIDGNSFKNGANGQMLMSTGFPNSTDTGGQGMLVYCSGDCTFNVGSNSGASLKGSSGTSAYKSILFFEDRSAPAHTGSSSHSLGGGGDLVLEGTIYLNNTTMTSTTYQSLRLRGNSGNTTLIKGQIIVSALDMQGSSSTIQMQLDPTTTLHIRQVALVQ